MAGGLGHRRWCAVLISIVGGSVAESLSGVPLFSAPQFQTSSQPSPRRRWKKTKRPPATSRESSYRSTPMMMAREQRCDNVFECEQRGNREKEQKRRVNEERKRRIDDGAPPAWPAMKAKNRKRDCSVCVHNTAVPHCDEKGTGKKVEVCTQSHVSLFQGALIVETAANSQRPVFNRHARLRC